MASWFETRFALLTMRDYDSDFGTRGSIGVVPRTPRISSSTFAPASSCASPRGGPMICNPTGRALSVKPQGSDSAGQQASVIA